ncbi:MAG TPA: HAD family hydrolase [Vicinamibacterales bacterium]|nr:HAD family hydrolase [Vicinamibacterales bacterium]
MERTLRPEGRVRALALGAWMVAGIATIVAGRPEAQGGVDPLPSWNGTAKKSAIVAFVEKISKPGSAGFVSEPERVAVFDNDGTLWPEAPVPFQAAFVFDELKRRSQTEPELAGDPMVKAALRGDVAALLAGPHHDGLLRVLALTHAGMTTDEFDKRVNAWLESSRHPRWERRYDQLTYQPMQELLAYLRANGFKTFIVSGGGADFMRVWTERVYGIPPQQVVGSTAQARFEMRDGRPVLIKTTDHVFVDDREGKPVGIRQFIGRRPILCVGNSDGDQAMLEYTTVANPRPSLGVLVHHTDGEREYAYDAKPPASGRLVTALAAAPSRGWIVVDMKNDWNTVFDKR